MEFLREISPINKFLFFPPHPPAYSIDSFRGELCNLDGILCLALAAYNPSSHIIIYCHGNASDIGQCRRYLVRIRDRLGMHVIAIEYPGYGVSGGGPSESSVDKCVSRVYNFAHTTLKWPKESIIIMGRSIGSGPAVKLASRQKVGALILLAAFTSIKDVAEIMLGKAAAILMDRWKSVESIRKICCPVLFIHGSADQTIPAQHTIELYNACQHEQKDIQIFENLDHNQYNWKLIIQRLEDFFVQYGIRDPSMLHRSLTIPRECFEEWGEHGKIPCEAPDMWSPIRSIYYNITSSGSMAVSKDQNRRVEHPFTPNEAAPIPTVASERSIPFSPVIEAPQPIVPSTDASSRHTPYPLPSYRPPSRTSAEPKDIAEIQNQPIYIAGEEKIERKLSDYDDQVFAEEKFRRIKLPTRRPASQSPPRRQPIGSRRSQSALPFRPSAKLGMEEFPGRQFKQKTKIRKQEVNLQDSSKSTPGIITQERKIDSTPVKEKASARNSGTPSEHVSHSQITLAYSPAPFLPPKTS